MPDDKVTVALVGSGLLAESVAASLASTGAAVERIGSDDLDSMSPSPSVAVAVSDGWDTARYPAVREACLSRNMPWLPVRTELGRAVVGPVELPGTAGCVDCAEDRRRRARRDATGFDAVWQHHGEAMSARPSSWLTELAAGVVAASVADDVTTIVTDRESARTASGMLHLDLRELRVTRHAFLPDPLCGTCGNLPDDSAESADIALHPRKKAAPDDYRVRAIATEFDLLRQTYVDQETGLIRALHRGKEGGLAVAAAPIGLRNGGVESGYGRTRSYRRSELIALLEALERYGGLQPGGKRTVVRAPYREVADRALDPRELGTHSSDAYAAPDFRFRPFDDSQVIPWVWGYSFARKAPILVPEWYGYYRAPRRVDDPPPSLYEISNGCALGGCLEEAILYGILEVAERDAFLMTWYTRLPAPRIDVDSVSDPAIPLIIKGIADHTGYDVLLFDITMEQRIPCVWAMAMHPSGDAPRVLCAAGSHPDPERAAENAVSELGPILVDLVTRYPANRELAERMADEPLLVRAMEDHSLVNANPAVSDRLEFLIGSPSRRTFAEMEQPNDLRNNDLSDDLREMVSRYIESGLDVIVVDQTTPEHRASGLSCVKVIIPGLLPMTFGHQFVRTEGIPRLFHVPQKLGYSDRLLSRSDINPHPHPFP